MDLRLNEADLPVSKATTVKDCEICWKQKGNYTCPRCNVAYCGLACYKDPAKHLACSELFYKDQVVTELKTLKFGHDSTDPERFKENRQKMVEILKRSAKQLEFDPELDESEMLRDLEDLVEKMGKNGLADGEDEGDGDDAELEEELDYEEVVELLKKIVNRRLIKHSADIDTSKASQFIYFEILQSAFVYAFLASLYDLDGDCLNKEAHETKLDPGFLVNWLEIQQTFANHSRASRTPVTSLGEKIKLTVQIVSNEVLDPAHRNFLNKKFFTEIIDDLALFGRHPSNFLIKVISFLYGQLDMMLASSKRRTHTDATTAQTAKSTEKPLNVFHLNRSTTETNKEAVPSKSRVQIIRGATQSEKKEPAIEQPAQKAETLVNKSAKSSTDAIKPTLKRLEFFFKWLNVNQSSVESPAMKAQLQKDLDAIKQVLAKETDQFEEDKQLVEKNLDFIKAKQQKENTKPQGTKLIEEL